MKTKNELNLKLEQKISNDKNSLEILFVIVIYFFINYYYMLFFNKLFFY